MTVSAAVDRHSIAMVRQKAAKLKRLLPPHVQFDDLVQCGMMGLLRAIEGYDPGNGAPFENYAQRWISGRMLNHLDSIREANDDAGDMDVSAIASDDGTPEQMAELRDTVRIIDSAISGMSDTRQDVMQLHYSEHMSISEIARLRGVTVPVVSLKKIKALQTIREALNTPEASD